MADKTAIMKEAQKYILKGQIDKAITELEKVITEGPDGNVFNSIGDLYLKKGDKKTAAQYHHKAAGFFMTEGFSLKALALYKKVLNTNPSDTDALFALGQLSEEKGIVTDAIKYYLSAADSLSKEGSKEKLMRTYQKILSLSPDNIPLRSKVAEIFLKEGLISQASKEYINIAGAFSEKGDTAKAHEYYKKVLDLQPSNRDALIGMGLLLEKSGDVANACAALRKAAEAFPSDLEVQFLYVEMLMRAGDNDNALSHVLSIKRSAPDNTKAAELLADLYLRTGDKDKAWIEYIPIIDRMISEGEKDRALRLLEMLREADPVETGKRLVMISRELIDDDLLASELVRLGDAYVERGSSAEARECFSQASDVMPDDEGIREKLNMLAPAPLPEPAYEPEPGPLPETAETVEISETGSEAGIEGAGRVTEGGKTSEEIFVEADIFSRYGLFNEAARLLESHKLKDPQNLDLHLRLKALYIETDDKESAVTECLVLNELYKRQGDPESAEKVLAEAVDLKPDDPRIEGRLVSPEKGPEAHVEPSGEPLLETVVGMEEKISDVEDYEESLAEADFYSRQGLTQEALKILQRLHELFPENRDVNERLEALGVMVDDHKRLTPQAEEISAGRFEGFGTYEEPVSGDFVYGPLESEAVETTGDVEGPMLYGPEDFMPAPSPAPEPELPEPGPRVERSGAEEVPPATEEYEDLSLTEQDMVDAQEMPDVVLDDDVLDIFQEFKKGLEKELGDEDSETHYNLGIAYKEMGLIDDAINEFQSSRKDPGRLVQSSTMLGVCYMDKGLYSLAVDVLSSVADKVGASDESYWPIRYDLAEAYEKNNNLAEALKLYTAVYGWNSRFRNISEKLEQLKARGVEPSTGQRPDMRPEVEKPKGKKDRVSYL